MTSVARPSFSAPARVVATRACALVACIAPVATAQPVIDVYEWLSFSQPQYMPTPEGTPIAGQDGWFVAGAPGGGAWRVYSHPTNVLQIPPSNLGGFGGFAAAFVDPAHPAGPAQTTVERRIDTTGLYGLTQVIYIFVDHAGPAPGGDTIGTISFVLDTGEPTIGLTARWIDPQQPGAWMLDCNHSDANGTPVTTALSTTKTLLPRTWYRVTASALTDLNIVYSVRVERPGPWTTPIFVVPAIDWYLAGGTTPAGVPTSIRLTAGDGVHTGDIIAFDAIVYTDFSFCISDCDQNGTLNIFDFICFGQLYASQHPVADCDGNGVWNIFDYICFDGYYSASCWP